MSGALTRAMAGTLGRQRGIGLAEMMVALVLGLLVTLAASAMLLVANQDFINHGANARLNDSGRYAVEFMAQALRQAAWADLREGVPAADSAAGIAGLDARTLPRMAAGLNGALPGLNGSDVLAVRFTGAGAAGGDGSIVDCAGFAIGDGEPGWSVFYVGVAEDGEAELRCKYRAQSGNWNADAVVRGVDTFQVLYGLDTSATPDGIPERYVNATAIAALDADLVPEGATPAEQAQDLRRRTHWKRVTAVRIALLLHGEQGTRPGTPAVRYDLFGGAGPPDDAGTAIDEAALPEPLRLRARRVFEHMVLLRNRSG